MHFELRSAHTVVPGSIIKGADCLYLVIGVTTIDENKIMVYTLRRRPGSALLFSAWSAWKDESYMVLQ